MGCERAPEIHCYHDGELSSAERDQTQAHLRDCAECRLLHSELTGLSALLSRVARAAAPESLMLELRRTREATQERMVIRMAGWLTAAAAAIILGALVTWPTAAREPADTPSQYQIMAALVPSDVITEGSSDRMLLAQWMADEFSAPTSGDLQ